MKRKAAVIPFITLFFIFNLPLLVSDLSTDKEQEIYTASESVTIANISSNVVNTDPIAEDIQITNNLEPSVDIKLYDARDDADLKAGEKHHVLETENVDVVNKIISNNTPVVVTSESSTIDFDLIPDISKIITSKHKEIEDAQDNIPENNTNTNHIQINEVTPEKVNEVEVTTERNITGDKSEDIPSFSEWAQKRLEEVEKNEQVNSSAKAPVTNGKIQSGKLRWKNYASLDCGAKVVAANPESVSPGAILSLSSEEYKLNPCTSRIWFVVELCEAIQIKKIDLANYELFSSSPKDFTVSVSDRYPTRDWSFVGMFTARDERDLQSFDLDMHIFGKYIKVEIKSHYGAEHYCPISLFRAYGTSVFEVLQKEDPAHINRFEDDDDDEDDSLTPNDNSQRNLFSSATDAVISIFKRAAEVLGNKVNNQTEDVMQNHTSEMSTCSSPRHIIVCNNCNETLFGQIYELISCKASEIQKLVSIPAIYKALVNSLICQNYGLDLKNITIENSYVDNIESFFPAKYIGAMCNEAAVLKAKLSST